MLFAYNKHTQPVLYERIFLKNDRREVLKNNVRWKRFHGKLSMETLFEDVFEKRFRRLHHAHA
jgi:hypothetical protein